VRLAIGGLLFDIGILGKPLESERELIKLADVG